MPVCRRTIEGGDWLRSWFQVLANLRSCTNGSSACWSEHPRSDDTLVASDSRLVRTHSRKRSMVVHVKPGLSLALRHRQTIWRARCSLGTAQSRSNTTRWLSGETTNAESSRIELRVGRSGSGRLRRTTPASDCRWPYWTVHSRRQGGQELQFANVHGRENSPLGIGSLAFRPLRGPSGSASAPHDPLTNGPSSGRTGCRIGKPPR